VATWTGCGPAPTLVTGRLPGADPAFVSACHAASAGNPFMLGALVDQVVAEDLEPSADVAARLVTFGPEQVARSVEVQLECDPIFDYGRRYAHWEYVGEGYNEAVATADGWPTKLTLTTDLRVGFEGSRVRALTTLRDGDTAFVALAFSDHAGPKTYPQAYDRLAPYLEEGIHSLKGLPNVISIRNIGMIGCVEVAPRPGAPGKRGYELFLDTFWNQGVLTRASGDTVVIAPPFIAEKKHIDQMIDALGKSLKAVQ